MKDSSQVRSGAGGGARPLDYAARYLAPLLLLYGALGVLVELRFLDLLLGAVSLIGGGLAFNARPAAISLLDPLWRHYAGQPALPWLAWLVGLLILLAARRKDVWARDEAAAGLAPRMVLLLLVAGGAAVLLLGGFARLNLLLPQARGLSEFPFDDEGVYAGAAQLFLQGIMPYRDYFLAHPPLAAVVYAPAMAYHFTPWGSETSFMIARYLSVGYSLLALLAFLLIGRELGRGGLRGLVMGLTAALAWAVDGRAIEINQKIMLDQPMILASLFALLLYLLYCRGREEGATGFAAKHPALLLGIAGVVAAASALTKIQGIACFMAMFFDMVIWLLLTGRVRRQVGHLAALLGGFVGGALVLAGPFALAAPDSFIREVVFFQLLRPDDGLVLPADRVANLTADLRNGVTTLLAAVGVAALGLWFWRRSVAGKGYLRDATRWLPVVLWAFFNLLLFTYSRSFYSHYYIQIAAPLCLLAAAIWQGWTPGKVKERAGLVGLVAPLVALVLALPLLGAAWQGFTSRHEDRIFEIVGRYISNAVPPDATVLTTDEQFNLLAAREPSHNSSGYLVDSYGHLIYMGLGLSQRSWGDLISAVQHGEHSNDPDAIMHRPAPQADLLDRAQKAALLVVHYNQGARRLTDATLQQFRDLAQTCPTPQIEQQARYVIIRNCGN